MKYQFILNGKVVSALVLARYSVDFFLKEDDLLVDLLEGREVELDSFVSENGIDTLQLKKVKEK